LAHQNELACESIGVLDEQDVWSATGPLLLNRLDVPSNARLSNGLTFGRNDDEMRRHVTPDGNLSDTSGPEDWRAFKNEGRSIYAQARHRSGSAGRTGWIPQGDHAVRRPSP
jgi:hypothetical protein